MKTNRIRLLLEYLLVFFIIIEFNTPYLFFEDVKRIIQIFPIFILLLLLIISNYSIKNKFNIQIFAYLLGALFPILILREHNYPAYMIPLARRNDKDSRRIDVFQLIACGAELLKAYSELVDPIVQRAAFEEQARNKEAGDEEAVALDEDFLLAMEHGMPPISGLGLGIDRFFSIISNQPTLRDVILFPIMK